MIKEKTIVIIPTYDESKNIPLLIERLFSLDQVDVLVVDDNYRGFFSDNHFVL